MAHEHQERTRQDWWLLKALDQDSTVIRLFLRPVLLGRKFSDGPLRESKLLLIASDRSSWEGPSPPSPRMSTEPLIKDSIPPASPSQLLLLLCLRARHLLGSQKEAV